MSEKHLHNGRTVRVMFVCLGNICRSPLAEGVFRNRARKAGLDEKFEICSSGTGGWHVGEGADERMSHTASEHGVSLSTHCARQFSASDLVYFDHIFVMDKSNLEDVLSIDEDDENGYKVRLFREFDPEPGDYQVPDPYYGGESGFENVFEIVDRTANMLLHRLALEYGMVEAHAHGNGHCSCQGHDHDHDRDHEHHHHP